MTSEQKNSRATVVFVLVIMAVFLVDLQMQYGWSSDGVAELIGRLVGITMIVALPVLIFLRGERRVYTSSVIAGAVMGFFALQKVPSILWAHDAKDAVALLDADTAAKRQAALEANQSNKFADLMRRSLDVQIATIEKFKKVSSAIEPPEMNDINVQTGTPQQFAQWSAALRAASRNAAASLPTYLKELEAEKSALSALVAIAPDNVRNGFMGGVEGRQKKEIDRITELVQARVAYYDALREFIDFMGRQSGRYVVKDGRFLFKEDGAAAKYNGLYAQADGKGAALNQAVAAWDKLFAEGQRSP